MKHTTSGIREPLWQEVPFEDPACVFRRLAGKRKLIFLDSAMPHESLGRYSYIAFDPVETVFATEAAPLKGIVDALARGRLNHISGLPPFQGGLAGYIAYEFGALLEPQLAQTLMQPTLPVLQMQAYDAVLAFDHAQRRAFMVSTGYPASSEDQRLRRAQARLQSLCLEISTSSELNRSASTTTPAFRSNFSRSEFEAAVRRTIEYVLAGDIFQANIAQKFSAEMPADFDAVAYYERLRARNPSTFAAYFDFGELKVCSSSPERLLSFDGRQAEARPIKGTRRRVKDSGVDAILKADLLASRKDRAENVMIVDLLRNDLSRVCDPGSVEVPVLCGLESYSSVHHLVSVITGTLSPGYGATDLVAACFPGGSITGAPKIRAMEIIAELERVPRDVYCGSIGFMGFNGWMDFNIAIRTVTFHGNTASFHGGGGITARSDPSAEFDESIAKVQRLMEAFTAS